MRIVILGGGIIGTASCWYLRRDGHEVTVVERQADVALETSFANACQISTSHSEPWAGPGAPRKLLQWLGREEAPLLLRPRFDPQQWLWALQFLTHCTPGSARSNLRACLRLALHSRAMLRTLRAELALEYDHLERGILHLYSDESALESARGSAALMRELGCERRFVTADEAIEIEPALAAARARIVGADYCAEDESGDILAFTQKLARRAAEAGVEFLFGHTATRILAAAGKATGVEVVGADGWHRHLEADAVVVAAGSFSRALLAPLGVHVPVYPGKGYSATFAVRDPARAPSVSVTDDAWKIAATRIGNRLRVAGTVELGGFERDLNPVRCAMLTRRARELFPEACDYGAPRYWAGLRPMTPSGVPFVGRTRMPQLFVNTGHGTLGWTLGVGSGHVLADVVAGRAPAVETRSLR